MKLKAKFTIHICAIVAATFVVAVSLLLTAAKMSLLYYENDILRTRGYLQKIETFNTQIMGEAFNLKTFTDDWQKIVRNR